MKLGEAVRAAAVRLAAARVETPELDARVLAGEAFAAPAARLIAQAGDAAPEAGLARFLALVERRASGEPVGRILGRREFWGLSFALAPDTLEPRPDTETVVQAALSISGPRDRALSMLDLGTGTGCILLSLLHEHPNAAGIGLDRSPGAAATARRNAEALGLASRASFVVGDWAACVEGRFDLVVSNPPYIARDEIAALEREVREHDPRLALDGGAGGLEAYRAIVAELPRLLAPGGHAVLELGAGQREPVARLAASAGLVDLGAATDLSGGPRALTLAAAGGKAGRDR